MEEEKLYKEIRENFSSEFKNNILPLTRKFEKKRNKINKIFKIVMPIIAIPILFIIILAFSDKTAPIFLKIFAIVLFLPYTFAINFYIYAFTKKWFENEIKKEIMPIFCKCFPNLIWKNTAQFIGISLSVPNDIIKESNLISDFERICYDDCFYGEHNGIKFSIEEGVATDNNGKSSRILYIGPVITLEMNKNFNGNTVIHPDTASHSSPAKNLHHTILEDVEFEKKFDVYTDNDIEARYLITPSFMERIKSVQLAFKANKISASFYKNKFFIAPHANRELFSLGSLRKNVCEQEQFLKMLEEILSILKLIDHFKLNQNIGM